jgi:hypothetical protein
MTTHTIRTREEWLAAAARLAADRVCLAAAPTFAIMALLTGVLGGGPQDMFCAAAHDASPLNGMAPMYLLMSAFHSAPWLKLISRRRNAAQSRSGVRQIGPESTDRTQLA